MPNSNESRNKPNFLRVEALEPREVPASFAAAGGLSIALADVMPGDFTNEYITGTGPGVQGTVRVWSFDGKTLKDSFKPFGSVTAGVYVSSGDVNNDGQIELICSTAPGTLGQVKVYAYNNGGRQELGSFLPYGPTYVGGVQLACNDVTGDRKREIITGRERGSPLVKVFSFDETLGTAHEIRSFLAFGGGFKGGVTVAAANIDVTNNKLTDPYDYNYAEVVIGAGSERPQVKIFDVQTTTPVTRASYMAYNTAIAANRQGINVVAGNTDGRRGAEIYAATKNSGTIRVFNGWTGAFITQIRPYPATYSRMVNFCIAHGDDDFLGFYSPADLIVVAGDRGYFQVPLIFMGAFNSPAGLNGSKLAG